jgi:hypothetical protein
VNGEGSDVPGAAEDGPEGAGQAPLFEFVTVSALAPAGKPEDSRLREAGNPDRWAHRRGEPRVFAFFWTTYVLLAVAGSLTWLARSSVVSVGAYGPAARIMLVVIAVGIMVLWPMTRLSQASPERNSLVSSLADLLVIELPVQIVVWPLYVLANWPRDIVMALAALMVVWGVVSGGVLALAMGGRAVIQARDPRLGGRVFWMLLVLVLVLGGPVIGGVIGSRGGKIPGWLTMTSPITAIPALTGHGLIGPGAPVTRVQWDTIVTTLSLGVFAWSLAALRNGLDRGDGVAKIRG